MAECLIQLNRNQLYVSEINSLISRAFPKKKPEGSQIEKMDRIVRSEMCLTEMSLEPNKTI